MNKYKQIVKFLDDSGVDYVLTEHKPALTSKQAEEITGWPAHSGAKSIVFKIDDRFILVIVKGTNRVDFNKLRKHFGIRKARLATPEEVLDVMGVKIGACYPFPSIADVEGYVDKTLSEVEKITFSPGSASHHIRMSWLDYAKITKPKLLDVAKD